MKSSLICLLEIYLLQCRPCPLSQYLLANTCRKSSSHFTRIHRPLYIIMDSVSITDGQSMHSREKLANARPCPRTIFFQQNRTITTSSKDFQFMPSKRFSVSFLNIRFTHCRYTKSLSTNPTRNIQAFDFTDNKSAVTYHHESQTRTKRIQGKK